MRLSRPPEDQPGPAPCTCFAAPGAPHRAWCNQLTRDLVPGYPDSPDGIADTLEQMCADGAR